VLDGEDLICRQRTPEQRPLFLEQAWPACVVVDNLDLVGHGERFAK
jgi:hypothetical protein